MDSKNSFSLFNTLAKKSQEGLEWQVLKKLLVMNLQIHYFVPCTLIINFVKKITEKIWSSIHLYSLIFSVYLDLLLINPPSLEYYRLPPLIHRNKQNLLVSDGTRYSFKRITERFHWLKWDTCRYLKQGWSNNEQLFPRNADLIRSNFTQGNKTLMIPY